MIQVDNTLLCDVAKCDAAAVARHGLGLRGCEEKVAADIGNAFHAALEGHFRGQTKEQVLAILVREHRKLFPNEIQPAENRFTLENCLKIMERYCDVRPLDRVIEVTGIRPVSFEQVVGFELAEDIMFYVKRDMLVESTLTGLQAPLDHKTTKAITDWWSKKYRMTSQMTGYVWAGQQETGQPGNECYVNAIEVREVPGSGGRCPMHKVAYSECGIEHVGFELLIYERSPEMIEAWKRDAIILARQFGVLKQAFPTVEHLAYARRNGAFNESCTFCEFKKWCKVGFDPGMMAGLVVEERWEPWKEARPVATNGTPFIAGGDDG